MNLRRFIQHPATLASAGLAVAGAALKAGMVLSSGFTGGPAIFGCESTGSRSQKCQVQIDPITIPPGSTSTLWSLPAPASNEQIQISATFNGGTISGCQGAAKCNGWIRRALSCTYANGQCLNNVFDASDVLLGSLLPAVAADAGSAITVSGDGANLLLTFSCPAGGPTCSVGASVTYGTVLPFDGGQFDAQTPVSITSAATSTGATFFDAVGGQTCVVSGVSGAIAGVTAIITQGSMSVGGLAVTLTGPSTASFVMPANPHGSTLGSSASAPLQIQFLNPGGFLSNTVNDYYLADPGAGLVLVEGFSTLSQFTPQVSFNQAAWFQGILGAFNLYASESLCTTTTNWSNGVTAVTNLTGPDAGTLSTCVPIVPKGDAGSGACLTNSGFVVNSSQATIAVRASDTVLSDEDAGILDTVGEYSSSNGTRAAVNILFGTSLKATLGTNAVNVFNTAQYDSGARSSPYRFITTYDLNVDAGNVGVTGTYNGSTLTPFLTTTPSGDGGIFDNGPSGHENLYLFWTGTPGGPGYATASWDIVLVYSGLATPTQAAIIDTFLAGF